jgi:hypothetical protein
MLREKSSLAVSQRIFADFSPQFCYSTSWPLQQNQSKEHTMFGARILLALGLIFLAGIPVEAGNLGDEPAVVPVLPEMRLLTWLRGQGDYIIKQDQALPVVAPTDSQIRLALIMSNDEETNTLDQACSRILSQPVLFGGAKVRTCLKIKALLEEEPIW